MSYQPTNWKTGDVITEGRLNKLENGVASITNDIMFIESNGTELTKTWQEVYDAMLAKKICVIYTLYPNIGINNEIIIKINNETGSGVTNPYSITTHGGMKYACQTPNDYLELSAS